MMKRALLILISLLVCCVPAFGQMTDAGRARVGLVSERLVAVPGETVWFGLVFEMDPGWHIYWQNPGDAGIPPKLIWDDSSTIQAPQVGEIRWPVPELLPIVDGEIMDYGYSDKVVLPFSVTLPEAGPEVITLSGTVEYLICENICIPERAVVKTEVRSGGTQSPNPQGAQLINRALADVPPPIDGLVQLTVQDETWVLSVKSGSLAGLRGDVRFFPLGHDIVHAAEQAVEFGPEGLQVRLMPDASGGLPEDTLEGVLRVDDLAFHISAKEGPVLAGTAGASRFGAGDGPGLMGLLLLALFGGVVLNLMPCVLPVLSIKALGFVRSAAQGGAAEVRTHGLWYTAGVLSAFFVLAMGVLAVRVGAGVATWGFWLQDARIVTALILLVFVIGLWLLDLIQIGDSIQGFGSGLAGRQGRTGAFFTGGLAAVVGAPCTGPFLGAALGSVMMQPAPNVLLVLITMGFGLALPVLILSFLPGLQNRLPKPGPWMLTLKHVFAFPMFLTSAWLLSVLGALSDYRSVAVVAAGAVLIGFGLWAWRMSAQGAKTVLLSVLGLAMIVPVFTLVSVTTLQGALAAGFWLGLFVGLIAVTTRFSAALARTCVRGLALAAMLAGAIWPLSGSHGTTASQPDNLVYSAAYPVQAWSPAQVAAFVAQGRPVFVDFTAEWCATCQANKIQTLSTARVAELFQQADVAFLVADYTRFDVAIAAALVEHGRAGVPMYLWYEPGNDVPAVLPEVLSVSLIEGLLQAGQKP